MCSGRRRQAPCSHRTRSAKDTACLWCEESMPPEEPRSFLFCLPSARSRSRKYAGVPKTAHSLGTSTLPPHMSTTEATELFLTAITTPPGVHLSLPVHWHNASQPRRLCSLSWPKCSMVVGPAHHVPHIRFRQSSRSPAFSVCVTKTSFSVHHDEPRARHILTCLWIVSLVFLKYVSSNSPTCRSSSSRILWEVVAVVLLGVEIGWLRSSVTMVR